MELKLALDSESKLKEELAEAKAQFDEQHSALYNRIKGVQETIADCKGILKENAEAGYAKDGIKKRDGGIGIRVMQNLEYDDAVAFEWAKEHKLCLALDVKAFKAVAKTQSLDFVKETKSITVTFPKEIELEAQ